LQVLFFDMREHGGILIVSDHSYINKLYLGKNKFFDKTSKLPPKKADSLTRGHPID